VSRGGRGQGDGSDTRVLEQRRIVAGITNVGTGPVESPLDSLIDIANSSQRSELFEVANKVLAPIPDSNHGDISCHLLHPPPRRVKVSAPSGKRSNKSLLFVPKGLSKIAQGTVFQVPWV